MKWNVDFEIASVVFLLVFLCFFMIKKHLPTRQNKLYLACVLVTFLTLVLDVASAIMTSYPHIFGVDLLVVVNTVYLATVPMLSIIFFIYILALTDSYGFVKTSLFYVFTVPALVSLFTAISSPFTGLLFYFDSHMEYHQGGGYFLQFFSNCFYLVLAVAFVTVFKDRIKKVERYSIYIFCLAIVLGAGIQGIYFRWVLLTNAVTAIALIIVYLAMQNPDVYIDKSSGMFNGDAFEELTKEYLADGKMFTCIYLSIADYKNLDAFYGAQGVANATEEVIAYLSKIFSDKRIYRLEQSAFVIQELSSGNYEEIVSALENRFAKGFDGGEEMINFGPQIVVVPFWHMPSKVGDILSTINFVKKTNENSSDNFNINIGYTVEVNDEIIIEMKHEKAVERAIDNAIANNSVQIYFQPIYSSVTGEISSCEALARIFDYDIGFVRPDIFISKAEENGSIIKLGEQIFEKVCKFLQEQKPERFGMKSVHVNLSPVQCKQENMAETLIEISNKYGAVRDLIDLEITETAAVEKNSVIRSNMEKLIDASFSFSLDDYGTGFSNTATIIQLPFKSVKIDKSLLWSQFGKDTSILKDLVIMFQNQELEIIVEGVESKEMVETLVGYGCQNLQGYYFSKPVPQREFMAYMRNFNRTVEKRK